MIRGSRGTALAATAARRRRAILHAAAAFALVIAGLAGCSHDLESRAEPSYTSPDGAIRFWAPASWSRRQGRGPTRSWHMRYVAGATAAAEQRHASAVLTADFVPERSDQHGATLFRVLLFTTAGYESLAAEPGMPAGTPFAAGGGRVAVAAIPTLDPYDGGYSSVDYERTRPSLDTLRAAVRLAGAEAGTTAAWGADTVTYAIRLPAADAPGREVRARFFPDGKATWTTTYFGKGYPIVEKAAWEIRNGDVTVTFGDVGSGGPAGPLTYAIADSALVPLRWPENAWGVFGAPLLVYRPR
ncbi:MAG: hypothetical protein ACM3JJ_00625 [Hyphomicrobiales bacterium]